MLNYQVQIWLLCASFYGVPQDRLRVFLTASKIGYPLPLPPKPTHRSSPKTNYRTDFTKFLIVPDSKDNLHLAITAFEAICDLDPYENENARIKERKYYSSPKSPYQEKMREKSKSCKQHYGAKMTFKRKERIDNVNNLEPCEQKKIKRARVTWNNPFKTVCTFPSDRVHSLHPEVDRLLSVREYARAQSFPDHITFNGPINSKYEQIGNSVPPILAKYVGSSFCNLKIN
jgi:DNA (cytosine-5)-methyltransferase 1